uniref:Uncharacterized protein n=1 Tax=Strombidium rassoulzadegani TaxID=1082188 RepID=A0A7S3FW97_9SPIT|mmetsp:Transcript_17983/g.30608  ORF Transcript_17983/g.30608 Transcript_17983/m.30608 type:complete len:114 (+) Transcript_17983:2-343(+)
MAIPYGETTWITVPDFNSDFFGWFFLGLLKLILDIFYNVFVFIANLFAWGLLTNIIEEVDKMDREWQLLSWVLSLFVPPILFFIISNFITLESMLLQAVGFIELRDLIIRFNL